MAHLMLRIKARAASTDSGGYIMKKVLSIIVSSLVSVSFAGLVFATEPVTASTPAAPAAKEVKKEAAKPMKKHVKKHHKAAKKAAKKAAAVTEAPATAPAAPAAK